MDRPRRSFPIMYFGIYRMKVGRTVRILMGCCFSMRPWLKTGGYRTFLSERGWVEGDFKVSIDSEFVFRERLLFESKRRIVMFERSSLDRSSSDHGL